MNANNSWKNAIPIIDIAPYLDGSDKTSVATQIGKACEEIGFFLIRNHGLSLDLLERVQAASTRFFDLPLQTKLQTTAPFGLGYMGQGKENHAKTLQESSKVQDFKESLNLTLPVRDNVWPHDKEMRELGQIYYEQVQVLANQLMRLFALALNLDENFFGDKTNEAYTTLRLLNYPKFDIESSSSGMATARSGEHTDYGILTILWSPDSRGLQARSRNGEWVDVIAPKDNFVINIGDLMMHWTNDKWISTLHRVTPHPETLGQRRYAMPFFFTPNPDAMIECIPSCHDETNPPKYAPILAKAHLEIKVSRALGKEEKMSDL